MSIDSLFGDKYVRGHRSVPSTTIKDGSGVTSSTAPFYFSRVTNGVHYASIYNDVDNNGVTEGHYINGVITDEVFIERGERFDGCTRYEEGCNHYSSYPKWEYGTLTITQVVSGSLYPSAELYPSEQLYPQGI